MVYDGVAIYIVNVHYKGVNIICFEPEILLNDLIVRHCNFLPFYSPTNFVTGGMYYIGVAVLVGRSVYSFFRPHYFSTTTGQISLKLHGKFQYEVEMCLL